MLKGVPILGSLPQMAKDSLGMLDDLSALGEVSQMRLGPQQIFFFKHPDHIKRIFVDNHRNYGKQTHGYKTMRLALGMGLVTSDGDFWKRQRRIAQPAFHHRRIKGFAESMVRNTEDILQELKESYHQAFDLDEVLMQLTFRIVGECLVSTDLTDDSQAVGAAITMMLRDTMARIRKPYAYGPLWLPTPANYRYKKALKSLDDVIYGIIEGRKGQVGQYSDLLDMFMEAKDEETGEGMSPLQLRDEVMTMVLAGHETTSNALAWTFYLLHQNPHLREELEAELQQVLGGRSPTIEDLPELKYTEAVIKEAMRLYPPVWLVGRSATEDDVVGGYQVNAGAITFISPYITHRHPEFWTDPEKADPTRFLGDQSQRHRMAYIPFAAGPRVCIGNGFAMMEAKLLLACFAQNYRFHLVDESKVELEPTITLRPKNGLLVEKEAVR